MPERALVRRQPYFAPVAKKYREVRRALRRAGWIHIRTKGDHEQWQSPDGRNVVTVAGQDSKDVPVGTLKSIRQSTGLEDLR
jgi:predicted RNA binding protein YcfA (HicA-like mRNA interferase family)